MISESEQNGQDAQLNIARRHLERLAAHPRPAGSPAEREARAYCAAVLRGRGFEVQEEPFTFSAAPGRLATSWSGIASIFLLAAAGHLGWRGHGVAALWLLLVGGSLVGGGVLWLIRHGVLDFPWWREEGVNLVATRGVPSVWLVAHLDSKSQPVPILVRALGVMATLTAWGIALAVALAQSGGASVASLWPWVTVLGIIAGAPVAASVVRSRSVGALDNASGVATVLLVAERAPGETPIGVLLTSAEELGLAGARAWVRGQPRGTAVNFDGIDDVGTLRLTYTGKRPAKLISRLEDAAQEKSVTLRTGPLLPGVLLDGVALAAMGWEVVTISRGTWRTVARIHTPRDNLDLLSGIGIAQATQVVLRALAENP